MPSFRLNSQKHILSSFDILSNVRALGIIFFVMNAMNIVHADQEAQPPRPRSVSRATFQLSGLTNTENWGGALFRNGSIQILGEELDLPQIEGAGVESSITLGHRYVRFSAGVAFAAQRRHLELQFGHLGLVPTYIVFISHDGLSK